MSVYLWTKRHLTHQQWLKTLSFWHIWLPNVLRATMARTFSTSQLPQVVRDRRALTPFTSKCASRHNGVQFFIFPLASISAPAALASLLFDPPEPQNTGKVQCFGTSLPFRAPASFLFWLSPSLIFPSDFLHVRVYSWLWHFHLSILSEV